jgi:hypothetical protein
VEECVLLCDVYKKRECATLLFASGRMSEVLIRVPHMWYESGGTVVHGFLNRATRTLGVFDVVVIRGRHASTADMTTADRLEWLRLPLGARPAYLLRGRGDDLRVPADLEPFVLHLDVAAFSVYPDMPKGWKEAEKLLFRGHADYTVAHPRLYGLPDLPTAPVALSNGVEVAPAPNTVYFDVPVDPGGFVTYFRATPGLRRQLQLFVGDNSAAPFAMAAPSMVTDSVRDGGTVACTCASGDTKRPVYKAIAVSTDRTLADSAASAHRVRTAQTASLTALYIAELTHLVKMHTPATPIDDAVLARIVGLAPGLDAPAPALITP